MHSMGLVDMGQIASTRTKEIAVTNSRTPVSTLEDKVVHHHEMPGSEKSQCFAEIIQWGNACVGLRVDLITKMLVRTSRAVWIKTGDAPACWKRVPATVMAATTIMDPGVRKIILCVMEFLKRDIAPTCGAKKDADTLIAKTSAPRMTANGQKIQKTQ
jgi:hypothetical protein